MLVEDDNNLREIYEARLLAEGYEIVSAKDGEEALALAVKERPDLIISDVMMPKISGFDMLDILRSTPETKETKVIMMTALSQAEDKTRADKLGADRYLVKSQVTLEDVAKVAREVLQGKTESESSAPEPTEPTEPPAEPPTPTAPSEPTEPPAPAAPSSPAPEPPAADDSIDSSAAQAAVAAPDDGQAQTPPPAATTLTSSSDSATATDAPSKTAIDPELAQSLASEEAAVNAQINDFVAKQPSEPAAPVVKEPAQTTSAAPAPEQGPTSEKIEVKQPPATDATNQAAHTAEKLTDAVNNLLTDQKSGAKGKHAPISTASQDSNDGDNASTHKRIIQPINDPTTKPDLNALLEKEDQPPTSAPPATSVVSPGGQTVTPAAPGVPPDPTTPGNVIQPGGHDPNSIAL